MAYEPARTNPRPAGDAEPDRPLAICASRVFDPVTGTHLENHAVLIRGAAIAWTGPRSALPHDCVIADFPDCTVLPGLIDAHVHLAWHPWVDDRDEIADRDRVRDRALTNAFEHARRGVTTVRDLGAPSGGVIAAARVLAGDGSDSVFAAGRAIGAPGGHAAAIARSARGPQAMRRAVEEEIAAGARCVKVMATGGVLGPAEDPATVEVDSGEIQAVVAAAHAHGVPVAVHAHATAAIRDAVRAGADSIEHASGLDDSTAMLMAEHGTRMVPTISPLHIAAVGGAGAAFPDYLVAKAKTALEAVRRAAAVAARHGVVIVAGTDAGVPGQEHGNLLRELEALAGIGMSPADCLRAATSHAADLLNARDRGRLGIGSRADLVVVGADPLREPLSCLDRVQLVVQGGKVIRSAGHLAASSPHPPTNSSL